ncbi:MAG: cupredoxin family copper-binding protein [Bdellovibrionaceae bacterium]|nr:cupredoxin family copper-binding protein [Pseudobdellovibrionaceae bacterium]
MRKKSLLPHFVIVSVLLVCAEFAIAATHTITIEGMKFDPATLTVKRGDTIVWVNKDFFPHTATSENKAFDSGEIKAGASWKRVVDTKGSFTYVCTLHPTMKGSLTVN